MSAMINRTLGVVFILTALIGFVFSTAGVVFTWRIKNPVVQNFLTTLDLIDSTLTTTENGLEVTELSLKKATIDVKSLEDTVLASSKAIEDTSPLLNSLSGLLTEDLPDTIVATQISLQSAQSSARLIERVLIAVTSIPFFPGEAYNPQIPLDKALADVSTSLDPLTVSFQDMEKRLRSSQGNLILIQAQFKIIARHVSQFNEYISEAEKVIDDYQVVILELQNGTSLLRLRIPAWINSLALILTFGFVWLGIAQLALLLYGWETINKQVAQPVTVEEEIITT